MNAKNQYLKLRDLLLLRQNIWSKEVLHHYPQGLLDYPSEWLQELAQASHYELWKIDARRPSTARSATALTEHLQEIQELTHLPQKTYQRMIQLPSWAFSRVKEKKQHEISILAQALKEIEQTSAFQTLVDIGGGVGHFARIMAHYFQRPTISVERDANLQELGRQRLNRHPLPEGAAALEFCALDFQNHRDQEAQMRPLFSTQNFSLGLHTCGPLAVRHLEAQVHFKAQGLLNFGCCYGKMEDPKDFRLSSLAKEFPLDLSPYALTLATRSHTEMSYENFCLKEKVKFYRYALQLYLKEFFDIQDFLSVGDSPVRDYLGSFGHYATKKLLHLKLIETQEASKNQFLKSLDDFYFSFSTQQQIKQMFYADIIRWQYGRALELIILLDRAMFLEENGHQVELAQFFDEKLSPRNIGLLAYRI